MSDLKHLLESTRLIAAGDERVRICVSIAGLTVLVQIFQAVPLPALESGELRWRG